MKKVIFTLFSALLLCSSLFSQTINVIEPELQTILNQKGNDLINVNIYFKDQVNANQLKQKARRVSDKETMRNIVVTELKNLTEEIQSDVLSVLTAEELNGNVSEINCLWIANSINCKATRDVIYKLSSHPDIKALVYDKEMQLISPDVMKEISNAEAENLRATASHHILTVNADHVWEQGYTGKHVVVAVLDSGTNIEHKDIKANLWEGNVDGNLVHGWNFINNSSDISDGFGHGTHCAGIVCGDGTSGTATGVAPDAKLMTVKIVTDGGTGSPTQMLNGVQFAVANGADILSMSLGFKSTQLTTAQKEEIRQAFDNVLTAGVIVCAAAGNDGNDWGAPDNVDYPAACPSPWNNPDQTLEGGLSSVVCVGANDLIGKSSQGPSTWEGTSYNDYAYNSGASMGLIRPDISAPGDLIFSLNYLISDKYKLMSGTSQSTPTVAGVMALMLEKNSTLTPAQITEIIETTAAAKPATKNNVVGAGRIDALAAVNAVTEGEKTPYIKLESVTPQILVQGDNQTITVRVKNVGKGSSAAATSATLSSENDEFITIASPTVTLGQISTGNTKDTEFNINVDSQTPNGHIANFTLAITSGNYTWKYPFYVKISATPNIVFSSVTPSVIGVGQDINIDVTMLNDGTAAMDGETELTLSAVSNDLNYLTIIDNSATVGSMDINGTSTGRFTIRADKETPHNTSFTLFLETYSRLNTTSDLIYEFENDNEGWTTFAAKNNVSEPWWHSTKALEHGKKAKDSHSGNGHIMSETVEKSLAEYASPIDNYVVSPTKFLVSNNTEVSFYARAHENAYYKEHFGLAVSTSGNSSANDFTMLQDWTITAQQGTSWNKYTVDLSAYAGQEIYVAIRHFFTEQEWNDPNKADNGHGVDALNIDDIMLTNIKTNIHTVPTYATGDKNMFSIYVDNMKTLTAPQNLTVTSTSTSEIALAWDAVEDAQSYNVYRDGVKIANVKTNSYTNSNLEHNTTYCYQVRAIYAGVEFDPSTEVCATTKQKDLSAIIKNFTPEIIYIDGETTVNFEITIQNDGANQLPAKSYYTLSSNNAYLIIANKEFEQGANDPDILSALNPNAEATKIISVTFSENTPNKSVIDFNLNLLSAGTQGTDQFTFDLPFSVYIKNDPKAPKGLVVKDYSDDAVTLGWNAMSGATSYNVYRDGVKVGFTSSTSYYDNGLNPETTYTYEVTSVTELGESEFSENVVVTTMPGSSDVTVQSFELGKLVGETTLTATLINKGNVATPAETTAILRCNDINNVTIVSGTANIGSVAAGGTTTAEFIVRIAADAPLNHDLEFDVDVKYEIPNAGGVQDLTYTFDNDLNGWTIIDANTDNHSWYHSSIALSEHNLNGNNNHTNANISHIYSPSAGGHIISESSCNNTGAIMPNDFIVSPVQLRPTDSTKFEFYARSKASSFKWAAEHFGVFVSTAENATASNFETQNGWEWTLTDSNATRAAKSRQRGYNGVVTIGEDGTSESSVYPYVSTYAYSTSQQIYTASEIGQSGTISKISFYVNDPDINKTVKSVKIYIKHTTKTSFSTDKKDWDQTVTSEHLVYDGNPTITNSVLVIPLTFEYNGTDNLLICFDVNEKQTEATYYRTYSAGATRAMYRRDSRNYGPDCDNYYSAQGTGTTTYNPVISLTFGDGGSDTPQEPIKPTISADKTQITANNSDYVTFTVTPDDAEIWYTTGTQNAVQLTTNDKTFKTINDGTYSFYAFKDGVSSDTIEVVAVPDVSLAPLTWTRYSVDLEAYKDQKIWVAIRHFNCNNQQAIAIDDITISNVNFNIPITNTSSFTVTVNPSINTYSGTGAWNLASNWSKGSVPTINEDVIINGNATIESGNVTAKSITMNSGSLTVNGGATLTVTGSFLNKNTKAFIIKDGAQVFQNNDNVAATFNMYIDNPSSWGNDTKGGWQFIASPMTDVAISNFKPTSDTDYDLFKYDGTQELEWINVKNHGTDFESMFQQGRGYIVSYEAETSANFEGTLYGETNFSFKDVKAFDSEDHYNNFYLLGNPFPFNMDWSKMTISGVYNGYATISNIDGSYDYHTSGTINAGDGFMVKSTGATPVLSYAHNVRSSAEKHASLNISASNIYGSDNVIVKLAGQEDEGFSKLNNLNENIAEIYVENAGGKYGIFSFDEDVNEVKLGFKASKTGTHIIRIDADGKYEYITLVDNITGVETDMLKNEYSFTVLSTNEKRDRFTVKFGKKAEVENDNFVYQSGSELIIEGNGSVQIIDVMGRVVYNNELSGNTRVNITHLNKAAYIVRRVDGSNVNTQKIIIM